MQLKQWKLEFRDYWRSYVLRHKDRTNRNLHFIGTAVSLLLFYHSVVNGLWWLFPLAVFAAYLSSWYGHKHFEPQAFVGWKKLIWSILSNLRMFFLIAVGRMEREVRRIEIVQSYRDQRDRN